MGWSSATGIVLILTLIGWRGVAGRSGEPTGRPRRLSGSDLLLMTVGATIVGIVAAWFAIKRPVYQRALRPPSSRQSSAK